MQIDQIVQVEAYKIDLFTMDEIRWDIQFRDGTSATISEEQADWQAITDSISALAGFMTDYWEMVAYPAFKENRTVIYNNGEWPRLIV